MPGRGASCVVSILRGRRVTARYGLVCCSMVWKSMVWKSMIRYVRYGMVWKGMVSYVGRDCLVPGRGAFCAAEEVTNC